MTQGEARYWLCQSFYGHFLGVHAGGGEYNLSRVHLPFVSRSASYRYEGWALIVVGLVAVWKYMGYYVVIYSSGLLSISDTYYEATKAVTTIGKRIFSVLETLRRLSMRMRRSFLVVSAFIMGG